MTYLLTYDVAHEGEHTEQFGTLDEVKAWIRTHSSSYDHSYDNLRIIKEPEYVDVYELMKDG